MRLPRLTTRWLMVLVAVAGLVLGLAARRERLLRLATYHAVQANRTMSVMADGKRVGPEDDLTRARSVSWRSTPRSQWHTRRSDEYRQAASRPWLPVPPVPPGPK